MSPACYDRAFVLAAGLGTRLRPYTDTLPKPLVPVAGKPLLTHIFKHLKQAGVDNVVVNLHHKADILHSYLSTCTDVRITESYEEELLDTGGGIRKALDKLGQNPFFIINGDAFWENGSGKPALLRMADAFDAKKMDILLLTIPVKRMILTQGVGDYDLTLDGRAVRNKHKTGTDMFAGIRLCHPKIFHDTQPGKFSFLNLMDRAESQGRLYAIEHDGDWHHISTPQDLEAVNAVVASAQNTS